MEGSDMMSVTISINGRTIVHRNAVNVGRTDCPVGHCVCKYEVDDGRVLTHERKDGAVALAIEMLKGVHETKPNYNTQETF